MTRGLLTALLTWAATAAADIPPRNTPGCANKKAGASCQTDDKKPGTCAKSTCSRRDYSQGIPPKRIEVECLVCTEPPAADAGVK